MKLLRGRWAPGDELHAPKVLTQDSRIDGVRLGTMHQHFGKVPRRPWVEHHNLDAYGVIERHGEVQAIDAGGLDTHADLAPAAPESLDEFLVILEGVVDLELGVPRGDLKLLSADVDAGADVVHHEPPFG